MLGKEEWGRVRKRGNKESDNEGILWFEIDALTHSFIPTSFFLYLNKEKMLAEYLEIFLSPFLVRHFF